MPLRRHLVELRRRLTISAVAVVVGMIAAFIFTDPIIELLTAPIRTVSQSRDTDLIALNFDSVTSAFDLRMRISFAVGLTIAGPVWLTQIWLFLVPALTRREIRWALGFGLAALVHFAAGCAAGWVIAPHAVELMAGFVPGGAAQIYQSSYYYDFILKLILVVGVAFVLPVFLVLLNAAGVVSSGAILRGWRVAVVVATVFAAIATPAADVISMVLLAGILIVLYMLAAGVAVVFDRRRARRAAKEFASAGPPVVPGAVGGMV